MRQIGVLLITRVHVMIGVLVAIAAPSGSATITVDLDGNEDYTEIQPAIDAARGGDTVLVKPGEYVITEPIDFNRLHEPGDPAGPQVKNMVLRSEAGPDDTIIRMAEEPKDPERTSVVIFENGESEDSVLNGFTVTGDRRLGLAGWGDCGHGIQCLRSSPVIIGCRIVRNKGLGGGGVYCEHSSPTFRNCTISSNKAECCGWGCQRPGASGGGVCCYSSSSPTFSRCTITGNSAFFSGGGVHCQESSSPLFLNCIIAGNFADLIPGGGISAIFDSFPTFVNCTVSGNSARSGGGISCEDSSSVMLTNSIVYGNDGGSVVANVRSMVEATYSCIESGELGPGTGNINTDPLFVQPGHWDDNGTPDDSSYDIWIEGDYRLQPASPCIDVGMFEGGPTYDIEGNGRPCGAGVDMGAYEMGGCPPPDDLFLRGDSNSSGKLDVADPIYTLLYVFRGGTAPTCLDTADGNDDGVIDVADAVFVLQYLFVNGPVIPRPHPGCGIDPTVDELTCGSYPPCE